MAKAGPKKKWRYGAEFKVTAVKLSLLEGVRVDDVARELDIHPIMLSRWRTQYKKGELAARTKKVEIDTRTATEMRRLRELEREHKLLKQEHALLKKAIRFCSERRAKSSSSLSRTGTSSK